MKQAMETLTRKDFLKSGLRLLIASGMAALFFRVAGNKPGQAAAGKDKTGKDKTGETCSNAFICRQCGRAATCYLPQAQSLRSVLKREEV